MKINVNTSFVLHYSAKDYQGATLNLRDTDFAITVRALGDGRMLTATHRADGWDGCCPSATDSCAVDIFIPGGSLGCGELVATLIAEIPDGSYPAGVRVLTHRRLRRDPDPRRGRHPHRRRRARHPALRRHFGL